MRTSKRPVPGPGARITGLEPDPRRRGALKVFVDGVHYATVHEGGRAAGVAVGQAFDEGQAEVVNRLAEEEGAWRALLVALERRGHGTQELRRTLRRKAHHPEAVEYAIGRARELKLLDDAEFAVNYVETRAARGRGPGRLRRDLMALGVERPLIDRAITAHWPEPEEALDLARGLAEKRARQLAGLAPEVKRRRLIQYLARRGFTGRGVGELVRKVLAPAGVG